MTSYDRYRARTQRARRNGARRLLWLMAALALLGTISSCGGEKVAGPTPGPTLRPTFTATPEFTPAEPLTPAVTPSEAQTTPVTATEPRPTATPTSELPGATPAPASPTPVPRTATPLPPTPTPVSSQPSRMTSPDYGMQAFLWWRPEVAQRDLELIRDAGFRWVKQAFSWREIEGAGKGRFDWSATDRIVSQVEAVGGLHLMVRLDSEPTWASGRSYPNAEDVVMTPPRDNKDFADYCYALAARYKGRIAAYQLWNEPNLSREWGGGAPDPAGYVALLKAGYQAIKRADPAAIVISAGLAPTTRWDNVAMPDTEFLKRMYAGGAKPYFDALGAHGAGYKAPPELDPAQVASDPAYHNVGDPNCPGDACRIYCFRHVEDLRQVMVDNGDSAKQVVVLEFGWTMDQRPGSPYAWHGVTEEQQAAYLVGAYQYARQHWQPWVGVMSLIYMPDLDWTEADEQYWWSIAVPNYPQFYPRKSYRDLAAMSK